MTRRLRLPLLALLAFAARLDGAGTTLGSGQYRLVGASFDVSPVEQNVPVGVPAVLKVSFTGSVESLAASGARVAAELSGPSVPAPVTIGAAPGEDLVIPPLSVKGEHRIENIRLVDGAGAAVPAAHPAARVVVTDVLVTRITSRALTSQELAARGVVVNESNFRAYSFALGLAVQGRTIEIEIPTVVQTRDGYQPVGPPVVRVENRDERFVPPGIVAVPLVESRPPGGPPDPELLDEAEASPRPIFGVLVFPGNIRFLNQFFSVVLMVQNGAADGSTLRLRDVRTTISLPAASLRLSKSIPSVPDGAPVPVRDAGADGVSGTADDVSVLVAQATGQAEFVTEGLRVGTHEVVCELEATLDGIPNQSSRVLTGRARGSVVVRDPSFGLTFNHPDVIRAGEEYELRVTVANTSTVLANQVALSIDAASLSGAVAVGVPQGIDPAAALGDIPPGTSRLAKFLLRATRTGRVVASAFTSDGAVVGSLRLRTGVTNDGVPLSPDSFVFPRVVSILPAAVVDPATALVGIAHGLATVDPTAPGVGCGALGDSCAPPFGDGVVKDRVAELVSAARRASLGEPVPSAVADLLFEWLGARAASPAFDRVRRSNAHGGELESGTGTVLAAHLSDSGRGALEQALLDAAAAASPSGAAGGPVWALLDAGSGGDPVARLWVGDPLAGSLSGLRPGETGFRRGVPFAGIVPIGAPGASELAVATRPGSGGIVLGIEGRRSGTASLTVWFPDGNGGFRSARLEGIVTSPGSVSNVHVMAGATRLQVISTTDTLRTADAVSAAPTPFGPYGAFQDLAASPLGKAVSVVFNRSLAPGAADEGRYRLSAPLPGGGTRDRQITGVFPDATDERLVVLTLGGIVSPARPGELTGSGVPSVDGGNWSGTIPVTPRLDLPGGSVAGRVIGPDGTPLANAPVRLSESATDDLSGETFAATTSVTRTDATGSFFFDFVRKQDGKPFRIDSYDGMTGSKGYAVGSIRTPGETVQVDVVLQGRGTVQGTVVDGAGTPLAGIIVRCSSETDTGFRTAQLSQPNGGFSFVSVPVGAVRLQAEDPATNRTAYATVSLTAAGGVERRQLVLLQLPRTSLRGVVRHGRDGSRYAGVHVAGYGALGEYFGVRQTDASGAFLFESAPAGNARLELFDTSVSRSAVLVQTVTLVADRPAEVELTVVESEPQYGSVAGVVRKLRAGTSSAASGAVVYVRSTGLRTTTGNDGAYRLDGVPVGSQVIEALDPANGRAVSGGTVVQQGQVATRDLEFADSTLGSIVGQVVDQQGRPKSGALVQVVEAGPPVRVAFQAMSAADGSFVLPNVPPGTHRVQATFSEPRGGVLLRNAGAASVTVPGAGAAARVTVPLLGWVTVTGRLIARTRDRSGELHDNPVFAPVELHSSRFSDGTSNPDPEAGPLYVDGPVRTATVNTDPETGEFRFENVHGGPVKVVARNTFYGDLEKSFGIVQGDTVRGPVDLVYDGNLGTLDGYLYDADGAPIVGGRVTLAGAGSFGAFEATSRPAGPANGAGYFVFPLVPFAPRIDVRFAGSVNGVDRIAAASAALSPAAPSARVTLRALGVGSVRARVVRPSGNETVPVPGAEVRVEELEGLRRSRVAAADADGFATFTGVNEGRLVLLGRSEQSSGRAALFASGEGFALEAAVEISGTATVSGFVSSPSGGTPLGNVNVLLVSLGGGGLGIGPLAAATTGADGGFVFTEIPAVPGAIYRVDAEDSGTLRRGHSATLTLAAGDARRADVTLTALGSVMGRFTTFDGRTALAGAEVDVTSFVPIPGAEHSAVTRLLASTDASGAYRIDGVPAGSIEVRARDVVSGLAGSGEVELASEGQVVTVDLRATPTGSVEGLVRKADGPPLDSSSAVPTVTLRSGRNVQVAVQRSYSFPGVDATRAFTLEAREPGSPFHVATASSSVGAGETRVVDLRYGPIGSVRVHVRKPDPATPGAFLPAAANVRIRQGGPYANRFPSGTAIRTDAQGDVTIVGVGGGYGLTLSATEDGTGAAGYAEISDLSADGQQVEATIVVESRGTVRGRLLRPDGATPAPAVPVRLYLRGQYDTPTDPPVPTAAAVTAGDGSFEMRDIPLRGLWVVADAAAPWGRAYADGSLGATKTIEELGDLVLDESAPTLVSIDPPSGSTGLGLEPQVRFSYSEPLWRYGSDELWRLARLVSSDGAVSSGISVSLDATGQVVTVVPSSPLVGATTYEVRLSGSLRDRRLLPVGVDSVARFSTADLTNPALVRSTPVANQVQVPVLLGPSVVLSKAIDPATVAAGVHLNRLDSPQGAVPISPALQADARTILLNPVAALELEGEYEIVLDALRDVAGNPLLSTVRVPFFTRDDRAPAPSLEPADTNEPVEGTTHAYTVRFADDDVRKVSLCIVAPTGEIWNSGGGTVTPSRSARSVSWTVQLPRVLAAGGTSLRVRATATDFGGNASAPVDLPFTLVVDAPPAIASATASASTLKVGESVSIEVTATDDRGLPTIVATPSAALEPVSTQILSTTEKSRTELRTYRAGLAGPIGPASVAFVAKDTLGQASAESRVPVTVLAGDPPSISIQSPAAGAVLLSGSSVPVTFASSDDLGVASVTLRLGASTVTVSRPAAIATVALPVPVVSMPGTLELTAAASDLAGLTASASVSVEVQPDAAPVVTVSSPAPGVRVRGGASLAVGGTLSDDNGRASLTATLGAASRSVTAVGSFSFSLAAPVVAAETPMTLALRARDETGHSASPIDVPVVVEPDVLGPTVTIASPAAGASVIGGRRLSLTASASDDVAVTALRYRVVGGAWTTFAGAALAAQVTAPAVAVPTALVLDVEAEDPSAHVTRATVSVTVVPNQAPVVSLARPAEGAPVAAGSAFTVSGTVADDAGLPSVTATFSGQTKSSSGTSFYFSFVAPSVSSPATLPLSVSATDPEGNASSPRVVSLNVVPDVGGTPTVGLTAPAPSALLVDATTAVSITFADNVGLSTGSAEVSGAFTSGVSTFTLSGTSSVRQMPVIPAGTPFGEAARVTARNVDLGGRVATLDVTLPVAYHRLETPLPSAAASEGGELTALFRVSATGRQRAASLRLEIGTLSGSTFTVVSCAQKPAPLAEIETVSVPVPAGRTGLYVRSALVETTGAMALAARSDGASILLDPLATSPDLAVPTVSILGPADGTAFTSGDRVSVRVSALDDTSVDRIDVAFGGVTKSCVSQPCELWFFAPVVAAASPQTLTATAKDGAGKSATSSVSLTVSPRAGGAALDPLRSELLVGDGRAPSIRFVEPPFSPFPVPPNAAFRPVVEAEDGDDIARVEIFLGEGAVPCLVFGPAGTPAGACGVPDLAEGTRLRLRAVVHDVSGASASAETELVVATGARPDVPRPLPAEESPSEFPNSLEKP